MNVALHTPVSWVYFARSKATGLIKIGTSVLLRSRLAALRWEEGADLDLLAVMPGNHGVERAVHIVFDHLRATGEWFRPAPDLMAYIDATSQRGGLPQDALTPLPQRPTLTPGNKHRHPQSDALIADAVAKLAGGASVRKVAIALGLSKSTVHRIAQRQAEGAADGR